MTIQSGCTITIDTAAATALSVAIQSGGTLQFDDVSGTNLTVAQSVTIDGGGTFQSNPAGTLTTHTLSVGGNLTNNGTLDFSTNTNLGGAGITFTGAASNTFGGTGATTNVRTITINKGTSNVNVLELNPTNFTVQGTTIDGTPMADVRESAKDRHSHVPRMKAMVVPATVRRLVTGRIASSGLDDDAAAHARSNSAAV